MDILLDKNFLNWVKSCRNSIKGFLEMLCFCILESRFASCEKHKHGKGTQTASATIKQIMCAKIKSIEINENLIRKKIYKWKIKRDLMYS